MGEGAQMTRVSQRQWDLPWFYRADVYVLVTGVSAQGWFTTRLSLRGYARARASLATLEIVHISLVGGLASDKHSAH
jgi:hypothetical protein